MGLKPWAPNPDAVVITGTPASGDGPVYNGSEWVPEAAVSYTGTPATNDGLVWDGTGWVPAALVNSFAGRGGAVVPAAGDYSAADVGIQRGTAVVNISGAAPSAGAATIAHGFTAAPTAISVQPVYNNLTGNYLIAIVNSIGATTFQAQVMYGGSATLAITVLWIAVK